LIAAAEFGSSPPSADGHWGTLGFEAGQYGTKGEKHKQYPYKNARVNVAVQ